MTLVSPPQSNPGDEITADAINGPVNALAAVINGGVDDTNVSSVSGTKLANGTVTTNKLSTATGEIAGAWQSWTPTFTNLTVNNGTVDAKYQIVGKTVRFRLTIVLGSSTTIFGAFPTFSLPVAAIAAVQPGQVDYVLLDTGTAVYYGKSALSSGATTSALTATNVGGTYALETGVTSTVPFTWVTSDIIKAFGTYEAA